MMRRFFSARKAPPDKKKKGFFDLSSFSYAFFKRYGRALLRVNKGIDKDLAASNLKIHPEVYLSMVSFATIAAYAVSILVWIPFMNVPLFVLLPIVLPLVVLIMGIMFPKFIASNRVSNLKSEVPFAFMYISVMVSGGLSPYSCLMRLGEVKLFPKLKEEIKRIQGIVLSTGSDPVTAMEKAAKVIDLRDYKDLFLGYASSVRTGGDTSHYLFTQTETMFKKLAGRFKSAAESVAVLMETYTIIGILGTLGLYMFFVISMSTGASSGMNLSPETFFLFSFVVLPIVSVIFIYLGDMVQVKYPTTGHLSYKVFLLTLPLGLFLASQMSISFLVPELTIVQPLKDFVTAIQVAIGFIPGSDAAIGLTISMIVLALPAAIVDYRESSREKDILNAITSFLRDLVETRKTGMGPERCIQALSTREYGSFTKHLRLMSLQIGMGFSLKKVFESFSMRVKNWLSLINIFLLVDTLEVGGGQEKSLETLADFAEQTKLIEIERKSLLQPLLLVPYIGAGLLTATIIMFLQFFSNTSSLGGNSTISTISLCRILLTPMIIQSFMLGLVAGKISSGRISSGFKHAIFLSLAALIGIGVAALLPAIFSPTAVT
jgi:archaeal flagellar protein FlaJ